MGEVFKIIGVKNALAEVTRISDSNANSHFFFGYYDIPGFSRDDASHLCNHVNFKGRLPIAGEINEIGVINFADNRFTALATTSAWNFQQGSLLQWYNGGVEPQIAYNVFNGKDYCTIIKNLDTSEERAVLPVANISADGKYGVSISFNRVFDFRPGYGYCNTKDKFADIAAPEEDGVTLVDMLTGDARLIISYKKIAELFNVTPESTNSKIVINHITFNTTSNRFLFLVRYYPKDNAGWKTGLGTSDLEGNIYVLREYTYASHYHWKDEKNILIHCDAGEGAALYELEDLTQNYKIYNKDFFNRDIHCSYSPDRRFILGDSYPDNEGYRELLLYHIESDTGISLGKFFSLPEDTFDYRCDLHALWSNSGKIISFDSTHEGFRAMYTMDLTKVLMNFE